MTVIDDLAADARVQHAGVSPARGNVEIVGANQYGHPKVVVHHAAPLFHDGTLHMPHWVTCVDVEEFRR